MYTTHSKTILLIFNSHHQRHRHCHHHQSSPHWYFLTLQLFHSALLLSFSKNYLQMVLGFPLAHSHSSYQSACSNKSHLLHCTCSSQLLRDRLHVITSNAHFHPIRYTLYMSIPNYVLLVHYIIIGP